MKYFLIVLIVPTVLALLGIASTLKPPIAEDGRIILKYPKSFILLFLIGLGFVGTAIYSFIINYPNDRIFFAIIILITALITLYFTWIIWFRAIIASDSSIISVNFGWKKYIDWNNVTEVEYDRATKVLTIQDGKTKIHCSEYMRGFNTMLDFIKNKKGLVIHKINFNRNK